jgi:putative ABC transport system ATP-binding protein
MIMPLVTLDNVAKTYMDRGLPVQALQNIDLRIDNGEFTCLAGPSGSGKTTLLNLIGCLDRPSSGAVKILDEQTSRMSRTRLAALRGRTFGFVFQTYNLIPVLTAYENVEYVLLLQGVGSKSRRGRVLDALEGVGLADLAGKRPGQLSGGQQQRVAVARAIVGRPLLVLADEPTANLDSVTAVDLIDLLGQLNTAFGTTFLFSSHDPAVIARAGRIIRLRDGRILADENRRAS